MKRFTASEVGIVPDGIGRKGENPRPAHEAILEVSRKGGAIGKGDNTLAFLPAIHPESFVAPTAGRNKYTVSVPLVVLPFAVIFAVVRVG